MTRNDLGLPNDWDMLTGWFNQDTILTKEDLMPVKMKALSNNLPVQEDYRKILNKDFWEKFPKQEIPVKAESNINAVRLGKLLSENSKQLRQCEWLRGGRAVDFLSNGAPSHQKSPALPPMKCRNEESAYEHGETLSDTIAEWIKLGFVAGPFLGPPVKNFRVNPMKMVPQNGKIRPVLNVSKPYGTSFNDNVDKNSTEKVVMSSARLFSHSVKMAGKNAVMTKFDMQDAYKNVPCKLSDIRLQGFEWGGRFFAETRQIFGAVTAVSNFDTIGNTVLSLAKAKCSIPSRLVHRQLDDVPIVAPEKSGLCEEMTRVYSEICSDIGIKLAKDCPNFDKAFKNSSKGKVLGIIFDTEEMSWKLPEEKRKEYVNLIVDIINADSLDVNGCQILLGKLNFVCSMCQFMRNFKKPLQEMLRTLEESGENSLPLPIEVQYDLRIWYRFLKDIRFSLPIAKIIVNPPLRHKVFTTDAAGWNEMTGKVGVGCVGLNEQGELIFANQTMWDSERTNTFVDVNGKRLGSKTTTLELVGIIVPFLLCPEMMKNQVVVIQVDNIGCHFAWQNGYVKEDNTASILVRLLLLVSAKLECEIHITHHPRESSWESKLADRMSRESTTGVEELNILKSFRKRRLPSKFKEWMDNPIEDWNMPWELVSNIAD